MGTTDIAQGPADVTVSQPCDCDHHETCRECVPSLYKPQAVMAQLTADGVNRLGDTVAELRLENVRLRAELAEMSVVRGIDDRFGGRLALMLECAILNPNGYFDDACALLDEYKAEWEKVNPSPPTFMGEPMPTERLERLQELKAKRETMTANAGIHRAAEGRPVE